MEITRASWSVVARSVKGVSHIATNKPNQDSIALFSDTKSKDGLPFILAISDGYGSEKYLRSRRGSQQAVQCAKYIFKHISTEMKNRNPDFHELNDWVKNVLPKKLTQLWVNRVIKDIKKNPFSKEELEKLKTYNCDPDNVQEKVSPYGATLLAVLITEHYCIYFQLGDGDILTLSGTSEVARIFQSDDGLIGNETYSLSEPDAWRNSKSFCNPIESDSPALILASTDGYSNSFESEEDFLQVGSDILKIIREKGINYLEASLKSWLIHASITGSGDDISLGILSRVGKEKDS